MCKKCGTPLADPPTGRPPDYCGQACRRLAEAALAHVFHVEIDYFSRGYEPSRVKQEKDGKKKEGAALRAG